MRIDVYVIQGKILKYNIDGKSDDIIRKFRNHMRPGGIPLNFNGVDYEYDDIRSIAILDGDVVIAIERINRMR